FEEIGAGKQALDRSVDVVPGLGLTSDVIRKRLPRHLPALRHLLEEARADFRWLLRSSTPGTRTRRLKALRRALRRGVALAEELSPRTEFLDLWAGELRELAERLAGLARQPRREEELREQELAALTTSEGLAGLLRVIGRRRGRYLQARHELVEANLRLVVSV